MFCEKIDRDDRPRDAGPGFAASVSGQQHRLPSDSRSIAWTEDAKVTGTARVFRGVPG